MAKTKLNVFLEERMGNYIKERAQAEHRKPGNLATYLLTQKINEQMALEANQYMNIQE